MFKNGTMNQRNRKATPFFTKREVYYCKNKEKFPCEGILYRTKEGNTRLTL